MKTGALNGTINGKSYGYDGRIWSGLDYSPKELILMVEAPDGRRQIRLPAPWNRDFNRFLNIYINDRMKLDEVDKEQFMKCVGEFKS